jgi:hypothetical protein
MEILVFLALLMLVSLPFAGIGALVGNVLALAAPIAFWLLVVALQNQGILPGPTMSLGTALFAALVGVAFAAGGLDLHRRGLARAG